MSRSAPPRLPGLLVVALGTLAACDTTEPRIPAAIEIAAGAGQTVTVGTVVPVAPAVRVLTADGKPVRNVPVTFTVSAGGGSIVTASAATDRNGTAQASGWTVGTAAGENTITAASGTLPAVTVRATAVADQPAGIVVTREPAAVSASGAPLPTQPIVQLVDRFGNSSPQPGVAVTAAVLEPNAEVANPTALTVADGTAAFSGLAVTAPAGAYTIEFRASGIASRRAAGTILIGEGICGDAGTGGLTLQLAVGQLLRFSTDAPALPTCLAFELSRAAGHQYLLLFENMPLNGTFGEALFNELPRSTAQFAFAVRGSSSTLAPTTAAAAFRQLTFPQTDADAALREWDFGDGPIHEGVVGPLPPGESEPLLLRKGVAMSLMAVEDPQAGDTVSVYLEGIPRLSIASGQQKAVIRYLSDHLIFAEDVRLDSLLRDGSTPEAPAHNSPMTQADMEAIAREYAAFARVQGDLLFQNRHNNSVESRSPANRVLAVHTLMFANNIWGYTYSSSHYFAYDFWVGPTNGTNRLNAQHPQRVADDLFMHEIAHMRHYGLLERAGRTGQRGNQWLVEGFARFTERLPIAHRLLGSQTPARTENVVLPRNPVFGNAYYFDDVPTYLQAGSAMFGGYGASSFVFDYFADLVTLRGGDPSAAIRDFVVNAGTRANLDATVSRWLPDVASFGELFTRSRIALYADDIGMPLPAWTQYQQYQLRASRPAGTQSSSDPRNSWIQVTPGQTFSTELADLAPGSARGVLIDGTAATASARISIEASRVPNGVISITRLR